MQSEGYKSTCNVIQSEIITVYGYNTDHHCPVNTNQKTLTLFNRKLDGLAMNTFVMSSSALESNRSCFSIDYSSTEPRSFVRFLWNHLHYFYFFFLLAGCLAVLLDNFYYFSKKEKKIQDTQFNWKKKHWNSWLVLCLV